MNKQIQSLTKQLQKSKKEEEAEAQFEAALEEEADLNENIENNTFGHLLQTYKIGNSKSK